MTECSYIEEKLSAYMDGELAAEDAGRVERHLAECGHCSALLADLKRTKELVGGLEEVEPPPWLTRKIMAGVRSEARDRKGLFQRLFRPIHIKIPLEALAACLVAVLAVYVYRATGPETAVLHAPVERPEAASREFATAPPQKAGSPPAEATDGRRKGQADVRKMPEVRTEKESGQVPRNEETAPPVKAEKSSRALPAEEASPVRSGAPAAGASGAKMERTESLKSRESIPGPEQKAVAPRPQPPGQDALPAPSASPAKQPERLKKAGPDRRAEDSGPAMQRQRLVVKVEAGSIHAAAEKTENRLKRLGARKITRESGQNLEIIEAELPAQEVRGLLDALSAVGTVEGVQPGLPEGMRSVRIEIKAGP